MKKIFWVGLFLLSVLPATLIAQNDSIRFEFTPEGSFLTANEGKDYAVLSCPGLSQEELYNKFYIAVSRLCDSPKDHISYIERQMISYTNIEKEGVTLKGGGSKMTYDVEFTVKMEFKDGRVKIDAPTFIAWYLVGKGMFTASFKGAKIIPQEWVKWRPNVFIGFDENGNIVPKKKDNWESINHCANSIIHRIVAEFSKQLATDW